MATDETLLTLGDIVIPVGAGRGITQTLQPIDNGDVRRTVNGTLIDLTRVENRKFESQIRCSDMATPAIAELWKGQTLLVDCIQVLNQNINPASTSATLIRDPVANSIFGFDSSGVKSEPTSVIGRDVIFASNVVHIEFRPVLDMMILATSVNTDEYAAEEGWSIDLEEV